MQRWAELELPRSKSESDEVISTNLPTLLGAWEVFAVPEKCVWLAFAAMWTVEKSKRAIDVPRHVKQV